VSVTVSPVQQLSISDHLPEYTQRLFASLRRVDQRRWADIYLRGLLLGQGRKSIRRTAEEVVYEPAVQSLQQFVNQSPWDDGPVRAQIAAEVERRAAPEAWTIEYAITRKRGNRSAGVERRFVPWDGRVLNCQVGIGLFLTSRDTAVPVNWRLLLSPRWTADPVHRKRARIPEPVGARSEAAEILDMVDELRRDWRLPARPLLGEWRRADHAEELLLGLAERDQPFLVEVGDGLLVTEPPAAAPRPGRAATRTEPAPAREYLRPREARRRDVLPLVGGDGTRFARLSSAPVALAAAPARPPVHRPLRLIGMQQAADWGRGRYWVTNMPEPPAKQIGELVGLTRVSSSVRERLGAEFGLHSFEGRSYPGWHHHMTMVSAAAGYAGLFAGRVASDRAAIS